MASYSKDSMLTLPPRQNVSHTPIFSRHLLPGAAASELSQSTWLGAARARNTTRIARLQGGRYTTHAKSMYGCDHTVSVPAFAPAAGLS